MVLVHRSVKLAMGVGKMMANGSWEKLIAILSRMQNGGMQGCSS